jgi:hypothetical protein
LASNKSASIPAILWPMHAHFLLFPLYLSPIFPTFALFSFFYFSPPTVAVVIHFPFPFLQHQRAIFVENVFYKFYNILPLRPFISLFVLILQLSPCMQVHVFFFHPRVLQILTVPTNAQFYCYDFHS